MTSGAKQESSLQELWEEAKVLLRWLYSVCGSPCALIAEVYLSRKQRREIAHWLRPVEGLVRRLLVAEAARIAKTLKPDPARKAPHRAAQRYPFCRVDLPNPDDSVHWSVRFSLLKPELPPARVNRHPPRIRVVDTDIINVLAAERLAFSAEQHRLARRGSSGDAPSPGFESLERPRACRAAGNPWRLARRIEAVTRVLENPAPYARRLARRLQKDTAHIIKTCKPPPPRGPGERPRYGDALLREAGEIAITALAEVRCQRPEFRRLNE